MGSLLIYALLTPALFYLGSRAVITSWLWSRYPPKLARFMDCSACTGFWYGALVAAVFDLPLPVYEAGSGQIYHGQFYLTVITVGLCSMVWTPIVGGIMQAGFERLGSAVQEDDDGSQE
jgi:hypothetical protein